MRDFEGISKVYPVAKKRPAKKGSTTRRKKRTPKRQHYVPTDPEILDAEGAAAMLGVSVRYMVRLAREGTVPAKKVGRQWRFLRSALRNWLVSSDDALERALDKKGVKYTVKKKQ